MKKGKIEKKIEEIIEEHKSEDKKLEKVKIKEKGDENDKKSNDRLRRLKQKAEKIEKFLQENEPRTGTTDKEVQGNVTDNESAKMVSSHGVIQGYNGVTVVDDKHQVIVHAEAFGKAQEHDLLKPMVERTRENFREIEREEDVFEKAKLVADSGFHKEDNVRMIMEEGIDGYIADPHFRKRDPKFAEADRYKEQTKKERQKREGTKSTYASEKFSVASDLSHCICPAGKRMYRDGGNTILNGKQAVRFKGNKSSCLNCNLRAKCLRKPERTEVRTLAYFKGTRKDGKETYTRKMKRRIDSRLKCKYRFSLYRKAGAQGIRRKAKKLLVPCALYLEPFCINSQAPARSRH